MKTEKRAKLIKEICEEYKDIKFLDNKKLNLLSKNLTNSLEIDGLLILSGPSDIIVISLKNETEWISEVGGNIF